MNALLLALALTFQGSGDPYGYTWTRVADPMPAQVYAVDDATYWYMCGQAIEGDQMCVVRSGGVCSVYTRAGWLYSDYLAMLAHERKHCDGYDHYELWTHDIFTGRDMTRIVGVSK